jgi:uncharacterized protein YndB with AHSA1/START domain
MLATLKNLKQAILAIFERHHNQSAEEVWSWLTDNDKLSKWFSELRVDKLKMVC